MNKLYIRSSFIDSYNGLPELYRDNIRDALVEFRDSKLMKSRHPEKLPAYADMYSLRVDRRYRILMNKIAGGAYVLLLVGPHDVTYDWAEKNKKSVTNMSMDLSDYTPLEEAMPDWFAVKDMPVDNQPEEIPEQQLKMKKLFADFRDRKLLKGISGLEELEIIRAWDSMKEFGKQKNNINPNSALFLR